MIYALQFNFIEISVAVYYRYGLITFCHQQRCSDNENRGNIIIDGVMILEYDQNSSTKAVLFRVVVTARLVREGTPIRDR